MSEIDPHMDTPLVDWSELGVSGLLPTGTVTLLLADVEGSTRLWETQPDSMTTAIARLNEVVSESIAEHGGVRPVEQGEGDSFVAAFARASDAVTCALELQRAPLAPIRLRIGVHTGEIQLRDEGNYAGPTINRTARLRDLGHGGQTLLSGVTEALVLDRLPDDAWLADLGSHPLRDLPRPERVMQLCHPDLINDFPPLREPKAVVSQCLPVQLTSFVGREADVTDVWNLVANNRLVTLTGAGGVGKTRLAIQLAAQMTDEFPDGIWYVDLAPITDPEVVPIAVARAIGLPDQPGRSTMDTLTRFIADRKTLVVLDNCEHLLDVSAELVLALLAACPSSTVLTTSREPIGVAGEVSWRVPSLSLADEAIELFSDRGRRARANFVVTEENAATVVEICRRLDGLPLAIELAAARVRALSLTEILDSLHDRFRLLTGGSRTAVRRQQTLRASVDWSHALLTVPERVLFRRTAVFLGGFDLEAAQNICGTGDVERYQVLDLLTLLVDKSLVVADDSAARTRYRLLETVRQYALEKLGESGEADIVRTRHRDHYTALAALLDAPTNSNPDERLAQDEIEIDNLRGAFGWSLENDEIESALSLASSLQPLWQARGRIREGLAWFDAALTDERAQIATVAPAARARALADRALLATWNAAEVSMDQAEQALSIAREIADSALVARALTVCGYITAFTNPEAAQNYFVEAIQLARASADQWRLSQIVGWQARAAVAAGDVVALRAAGEEGRDLADAIGDRFMSNQCRYCLAVAQLFEGDLVGAVAEFRAVGTVAEAAHDEIYRVASLAGQGLALAYQGEIAAALAAAGAAVEAADEVGGVTAVTCYGASAAAALAAGDVEAAREAGDKAWRHRFLLPAHAVFGRAWSALAALAAGDLAAAHCAADESVSTATGWWLTAALSTRARVAIAQGELDPAERDIHDALAMTASMQPYFHTQDILETAGLVACEAGNHLEAARIFGAAEAVRRRIGMVRFKVWDAEIENSVSALRDALGIEAFQSAWAEGAALSADEAIAYAQRGRGQRKRPSSGWGSLTPTERQVVQLVSEGLANNDIATRLFVSPRTVQSHLTHVYTKLGLTSRVQLAQEAGRRAPA